MQLPEVRGKEAVGTPLAQLRFTAASTLPFLQNHSFLAWVVGGVACLLSNWTSIGPGNLATWVLAPLVAINVSKDFDITVKMFIVIHCFLIGCCFMRAGNWWHLPICLAFHVLLGRLGFQCTAATASMGAAAKEAFVTLRMLLDLMSDGFFVLGADGTIVGTNSAAQELLGGGNLEGMSLPALLDKAQTEGSQDAASLLGWGLSSCWAHRLDRSCVKLEMYTVPCRLSTACLMNLLQRDLSSEQKKTICGFALRSAAH